METGLITIPQEGNDLAERASAFLATVEAVRILTPEDAQGAVDQTREIKALAKAIDAFRKKQTDPLNEEVKAWIDFFRPAVDALTRAEAVLKAEITRHEQEERRKAAEAEKVRREQEAIERRRLADEQAAADLLLLRADVAAAAGDIAASEALEAQAVAVQQAAAPINAPVTMAPEKPRGAAFRQVWKCRIIDPVLVPEQYKTINVQALDAYARTMKQDAKLPGCEFFAEDSLAIR